MLDVHAARDRAVRRAVETGEMPNLDLIHSMQRTEGNQPCFGRTETPCPQAICRWHGQCTALATFGLPVQPQISPAVLGRFHLNMARGTGTYRDAEQQFVAPEPALYVAEQCQGSGRCLSQNSERQRPAQSPAPATAAATTDSEA